MRFLLPLLLAALPLAAAENPFLGRWPLVLPDGRAGWLGVEEKEGKLTAGLLWSGGSVVPVLDASVKDGTLIIHAASTTKPGTPVRELTATRTGETLALTSVLIKANGSRSEPEKLTGKRGPEILPAPDLAKITFAPPVPLLAGDFDKTWQIVEAGAQSGWTFKDGILSNRVPEGPHPRLGNLRTVATFDDFRLTTEVRTLPGSNSGIYLRGLYEIQIADSFGKPVDSHNMGALYSRATPSVAAEKPPGEWQTLEITLVDRHLTVILNGTKITDNIPVLGCTGGALTSEESGPGPLMLQGDHSSIDYRNMQLHPVKK